MSEASIRRSIWSYQDRPAVQLASSQELETLGLPVPRGEPELPSKEGSSLKCKFGVSLTRQQTYPYEWDTSHTFHLPRIFVVLVEFLEEHVLEKGLFRIAGSVSRQRSLRVAMECRTPSLPPDSNPHDAASLFKQFLRELPHPLLPAHYWGLLEACVTSVPIEEQQKCLHLSCLLLPSSHLQCLCVVMRLLGKISKGVGHSLMDANNLAVVMAPNLLETKTENFDFRDNPLKVQKSIVKALIDSESELGVVPYEVGVAYDILKDDLTDGLTESLEAVLEDGGHPLPDRYRPKKQRTYSLSDLMNGWGNKLKRQRGAASSPDDNVSRPTEIPPKKATKRRQHHLPTERDSKRPALEDGSLSEGVSRGTMLTPLLQPHQRKKRSPPQERPFRSARFNIGSLKRFKPLRQGVAGDSDDICDSHFVSISNPAINTASFGNATPPSPPHVFTTSADTLPGCSPTPTTFDPLISPIGGVTPGTRKLFSIQNRYLLPGDGDAATNTLPGGDTTISPLPGDGDATTRPLPGGGDATTRPLPGVDTMKFDFSSPSNKLTGKFTDKKWEESHKPYMFSSPAPFASPTTAAPTSLEEDHVTTRYVSRDHTYPSVLSPQCGLLDEVREEMAVRLQTLPTLDQHHAPKLVSHRNPAGVSISKGRGCNPGWRASARYSATLGISSLDLPRRKLRGRESSCDHHGTGSRGCHGDYYVGPSSPTIMSAALGITHIEKSSLNKKGTALKKHGCGLTRATYKENVQSHDYATTPPLIKMQSHDYATTPPLIKILESNVTSKPVHLPSLDDHVIPSSVNPQDHVIPSSTSPTPSSIAKHDYGWRPLNETESGPCLQHQVNQAPPTHRFRSPFLRSSARKCRGFTPVRERGAVTKRAQAYMITPHPPLQRNAVPLKRLALVAVHSPLKEVSNDIDVKEWLL